MAEHPLASRLLARSAFTQVKATGQRVSCPFFTLQYLPGHGTGLALGYTASTAGVGNAVKRNRARRRLKAAVHNALKHANPDVFTRPLALVLIARPAVLECPFAELEAELHKALKKAGVLA
jgi:ribonuclease P protein component